jgi:putative SOS response-associated peptidase YedK
MIRLATINTMQAVEEMKAHHKQQADILKEEEEECKS